MASRHDIINITFQANAGKANVALQTLQAEAKKSSDQVKTLKKQLEDGLRANLPADQIQKIRDDIKVAEREVKQWNRAYQELTKGVRTLDEAIKQFNAGTMSQMSAAFNKAAANAAKLAQTKMTPGTQEWKEMDALIVEAQSNVLKANTAINELTANIQKGGTASKSTLTQAKTDLEQLLTLEVRGSKEWNNYNKQLKIVTGELNKIAEAERKVAQADQTAAMNKRMKGLKTMSSSMLAETKRYWETMVAGAEKGSAELTKYEAKLKKVTNEEKRRRTASAEQVLATPSKFGIEQIRQAVQQMTQLRDSVQQGIPAWQHYNKLVKEGEAYLRQAADAEKIARGEAMSLADALKLSATAGGKGFRGTATQLKQAEEALQKAAAAAKKGSPEWQKYQDALAKVRVEMQNAGMTSERMQAIIAKPANAKNLQELSAAVKRAKAELDLMAETVGKDSKAYTQLAESTKKAEIQLKALQSQSHGTANAFDKAWSRLKTYIGLYMGAAVAMQKLVGTFSDIMELSDKMGEVRKTTGFTADEVGRLSDNLRKMDVRTSLVQLMEVSASAGQLGLKTLEDVQGFTEAANKLMIALPEMGREAATEMMRVAIATGEVDKIRKQLQEGTIEGSSATAVAMEKIASTIDRLRATSASTAPEITDFVKRVGAVGAQSGITIDQVSALGSTISSLGMRIEMSATALSRMIPAIKNNAFDIARAIGVTPDTIRDLFEAGRGMEAILMILQHMKDANMDEDSIEAMMNMGGMADIMKDLNQQGARAGIVFAGLSQNVDELRRQLVVANKAYEENIAIQNEFDKMNETTAARWERLKNQLEEAFVGDQAQRFLGGIVDGLRAIVNLLTGDGGLSVALKTILFYWAAIKVGIGQAIAISIPKAFAAMTAVAGTFFTTAATGLKALTWQLGVHTVALGRARLEWKKMDLALKSNYIGAIITAIGYLVYKLYDLHSAAKEAAAEVGRFNQKLSDEKKALDELFNPLKNGNTAQEERLKLINEINSKYSKYLGYMLSETSSAIQLAEAHGLIAKRIREEAYERRIMEKERDVRDKYNDEMNEDYGSIVSRVRGGAKSGADVTAIADDLKKLADQNLDKMEKRWGGGVKLAPEFNNRLNGFLDRLVADGKITSGSVGTIRSSFFTYINTAKSQHDEIMSQTANMRSDLRGIQGAIKYDLANNLNTLISNVANSVRNATNQPQKNVPLILQKPTDNKNTLPSLFGGSQQQGGWRAPWQQSGETTPNQQMAPEGWRPNVDKKDIEQVRQFIKNQDALRGALQESGQQITEAQRKVAESWLLTNEELEEYRKIIAKAENSPGGSNYNPWGRKESAESTAYTEMNAEELVNRRKQMKDFVNAIQTDSDVKAVLAEDKALQKAIEKGMASDMRTVIEWYNTERLKIQDELHARHLTNTGDWKDPKKQKNAHKQFQAELKAYLEELDAYYTERRTRIQEARTEEGISEAEVQNRTIANDTEWHQRRAELQKLYAEKSAEVTKEEQDAIFAIISERTGDSEKFVEAMIQKTIGFAHQIEKTGEKGAAMVHKWFADLGLGIEKDYLKQQQALMKQMDAIQAIIDKERPFNGITKNLRENLVTMGVLTADMTKERDELMKKGVDMTRFNQKQTEEELKRTTFLLGEAENAWSTSIEEVMKHMGEQGMEAWAEEIRKSPKAQEAMMAQLHQTYDAIQDAIKKEASLMKKQAETMWNNILLPGGDGKTTVKDVFEKTIAQLGIDQGRVSRANSLIGAGQASDRVADKLAIKQMQLQLTMQQHYFNLMKKQGRQRIDDLQRQIEQAQKLNDLEKAKQLMLDKQHAEMSLRLATTKEQTEILKQQEEIIARTEESEARLYKELREWGELLASSMREVFEASNAGNAEYYNELAKLNLTGKGGPGAGTYIVIDNEGTEDAKAHYEYLDERAALERQREIEQQNAQADAWKKVMDDLNQKMNDLITDQLNAMLQNTSIDANTSALNFNIEATRLNTEAVKGLTNQIAQSANANTGNGEAPADNGFAAGKQAFQERISAENQRNNTPAQTNVSSFESTGDFATDKQMAMAALSGADPATIVQAQIDADTTLTDAKIANAERLADGRIAASGRATDAVLGDQQKVQQGEQQTDKKIATGAQSAFAKMTAAANLYGIAYQAMSNDNLSTEQKFQMIAVQAAGQAAISALTATMAASTASVGAQAPAVASRTFLELGPIAGPAAFAAITALLGGLLGLAVSKIAKGKSEIAQATGVSVGAGRLATGMMTYAEGNVNELTDPSTLTPGRHYNVDGADGRTYRAKYMGRDARTHITTGPEFHLVGEKGREAIIDAHTTRNIQTNDPEIWRTIQTLYNGGSMSRVRSRRGRGVKAFAEGNLDDFEEIGSEMGTGEGADTGMIMGQMAAFQQSLDRNSAIMERLADEGIEAFVSPYGKRGIVNGYDTYKKEAQRHGERY